MNFVLNEAIEGGEEGFIILGVAGGIPGPVPTEGRVRRGVAVSMVTFEDNPEITAGTMIHEAGHYLGLFHTSESDGRSHDPLEDTPECTPEQDRDGNELVTEDECRQAGADNIMFWSSSNMRQNFSNDQVWVIHGNPAIR